MAVAATSASIPSLAAHFADFVHGLVRTEAIAFYAIVSTIALTLNASYLQWQR